jgi:hypothetical protein
VSADASQLSRLRLGAVAAAAASGTGLVLGATGEYGDGDDRRTSFVPPPWAFAIWGPIYAGLAINAVDRLLGERAAAPAHLATTWPVTVSQLLAGCWSRAFRAWGPGRVLPLIDVTAGSALLAQQRDAAPLPTLSARDRWTVREPIGLYAGWLTVASVVGGADHLAERTRLDLATGPRPALLAAAAAASGASLTASGNASIGYPAAVVWGLATTALRTRSSRPSVALTAAVGAAAVAVTGWRRLRRDRHAAEASPDTSAPTDTAPVDPEAT